MSGTSQHFRKPVLLMVVIAIVGLGAASAMAALAASSVPKPFELVFNGEYGLDSLVVGAFTSKAPFCESGSAVDAWSGDAWVGPRFVCADGSGSITLGIGLEPGDADWSIVEATGQYAGLRGRGTIRADEGSWWELFTPFRNTFQGVVAADAVAPTIAVASAKASKVKGTKALYTVQVALELRDDVEDNPVTYKVIVTRQSGAGPWLASKSGEATGGLSLEFRVRRPNSTVRAVLIRTTAMDPVGNESSLDTTVKLPK